MENLTLVGTIIAGISIIYNILTKLKNANLTKELLELEDLFAKSKIDNDTLKFHLKNETDKNKILSNSLNEALDKVGRMELVTEDIKPKVSRTKKSK